MTYQNINMVPISVALTLIMACESASSYQAPDTPDGGHNLFLVDEDAGISHGVSSGINPRVTLRDHVLTETDLPPEVLAALKEDAMSPRAVVGADDRRSVLDTTVSPYSSVVRIYTDWDQNGLLTGDCTGTLIRPDAVLTAAHCVFNTKEAFGFAYNVKVIPGAYLEPGPPDILEEPFGHGVGAKLFIPREYIQKESSEYHRIPYDYAVIRLKKPLNNATTRPFDVMPDPLDQRTVLIAYHGDIDEGRQMMVSTDKVRRVLDNGTFNHYTDAYPKTSGGGITGVGTWKNTIFAVNAVEMVPNDTVKYNIATLITKERREIIKDWSTQKIE